MSGWIKIYREIQGHWIWNNPFYFKAWICIIMTVNFENKRVLIGGELIECDRGQSVLSLDGWAKTFGKKWTIQRVRTFFDLLTRDKMLTTEGLRKTTRITVCNYNNYQDLQQGDNTEKTSTQQTSNRQVTTTKEGEEVKKDKKEERANFLTKIITAFQEIYFDVFQIEYLVVSKGKENQAAGTLLKTFKSKHPEYTSEQTLQGLREYFESCCRITDPWLQKNMSLPIIISKFNEINNSIKNGRNSRVRSIASQSDEIDRLVKGVFDSKGLS